jgi:Flp pilus assembly protein TadD
MRSWRAVDIAIVALTLATLAALSIHKIVTLDVWWQLATGEWILGNGWPRIDPFSYGEPGRPWIEMRWLYCVGAFLAFKHLGLNFLIVAKTLALLGVGAFCVRLRRGGNLWAAAAGIAIFALMAHPRFLVRPEILTFLFLAFFLERLDVEGGELSKRSTVMMAGAQLLWVNSHSTFLVGPAVLWIFAAADGGRLLLEGHSLRETAARLRSVLTAAAITTGVCIVNPYSLDGFLFPIRLLTQIQGDHPLNLIIQEFVSPLRLGPGSTAFRVLVAGAVVAGLSFLLRRRRSEIPWLALWLAFLALALLAQRNVALLGVASAVVVVRNLRDAPTGGRWLPLTSRAMALVFALGLLPAVVTDAYPIRAGRPERFGFGVASYRFPFQALEFVEREGLPRPVVGKLGEGGAFLFDGGPRSTLVDGRLEVYSTEFIRRYRRMLGSRQIWDEMTNELGLRTAVLKHTETEVTIQFLDRHPDWTPVYLDPGFVVFLKIDDETRKLGRRLAFDWSTSEPTAAALPPELAVRNWLEAWPLRRADPVPDRDLGRFFLARGELERSRFYFRQAHTAAPAQTQIRVVLALLERTLGEENAAASLLLDPEPANLARSSSMLALQARLFELDGRADDALAAYEAALIAGSPDFRSVLRLATLSNSPERALRSLQAAATAGSQDPALFNALGLLYQKQGKQERAADALRDSLQRDPRQPSVLNQLGILSARAGRLDEARDRFAEALALDPGNASARANLLRLDALERRP